jgi:DNA invertase Pin-like site-specific DNA recombinase
MTRVALVYARASADPSDQRISVDRQVKLCTARALDLWPDAEVKVFRDDSITAADPSVHRPGFAQFLTAVRSARKGELVGVVVNEQSRLTRQGTGSWDELVVTLTKSGISKVETLRSGPISVEPGNRLVGRLLAVVDAEEVERTKARCQDAHRELFNEGRPSSRAPFGYRSTKDSDGRPALEPHPVEAPIVRQVFDLALQGHAVNAIAAKLNADGVPPRSAKWKFKDNRPTPVWQRPTVMAVLTSPSVAGLRAHTDEDGQLHMVPARWPALIDVDQWHRVQRVLDRPTIVTRTDGSVYRARSQPRAKPRKSLLSGGRRRGLDGRPGEVYGVLRCGRCGFPLVTQPQARPGGVKVAAYACNRAKTDPAACSGCSISPADELETMVVTAITERLAVSPGLRDRLNVAEDSEAGRWRAERDAAKVRMLIAAEMFGSGAIDPDTFAAMHRPAKTAFEFADARLSALSTSDTLLPTAEDVAERWESLTLKQQRAVVERLIARIVIAPGRGGPAGFNAARVGTPEWLA